MGNVVVPCILYLILSLFFKREFKVHKVKQSLKGLTLDWTMEYKRVFSQSQETVFLALRTRGKEKIKK